MEWLKPVILLLIVGGWIVKHFADQHQEKMRKQQERPTPPPVPGSEREETYSKPFPEEPVEKVERTYEEVRPKPVQRKVPPKVRPKPPPLPAEVLPRPKPIMLPPVSLPPLPPLTTLGKTGHGAAFPPLTFPSQGDRANMPQAQAAAITASISAFEKRLDKAAEAVMPISAPVVGPLPARVARAPLTAAAQQLFDLLRDRKNLRAAFLLREIFEAPVAKRHQRG